MHCLFRHLSNVHADGDVVAVIDVIHITHAAVTTVHNIFLSNILSMKHEMYTIGETKSIFGTILV